MKYGERVVGYVDGYNLYYGLRHGGLRTSRWLDLHALCESLLKPNQQLALVRYFTTRVKNDQAAAQRQGIFIDALEARGGIDIDYGHFLSKPMQCYRCGNSWTQSEEKKTDVNIAVRLLNDAYDNLFDTAIIISGDSDLAPPVESVRVRFPNKRLIVAFPPRRNSHELGRVAHAAFRISKGIIRSSRLPDPVITPTGIMLSAPAGWLPT
ncbi:MAG: NYN domain-containing protein [bacterium]|nr:NYN domain-containing protein [bacterium]